MAPQPKRGCEHKRLAELLRRARKEAGLTQVQAAKGVNKPQSFISKCESGERRIDALELMTFARVYGKQLRYFEPRDVTTGQRRRSG